MLTPARRRAVLLAAALGIGGALGALLLPSFASSRDRGAPGTEFHASGDGSLPTTPPRLRGPQEPLSSDERGYAIHLAQRSMPSQATDVLGMPGGEALAADLPPLAERTSARLVTVAVYDYASDQLHQMTVDLTHRKVVDDQTARELQLPPSAAETTIALDLAMRARPAPAFFDEYLATTGNPLLTADQVQAITGVWRPVDEAATPAGPTRVCGRDRCVQLLLALPSGQYLGTQDFAVDLSSRRVLPVGPGELEHHHDD